MFAQVEIHTPFFVEKTEKIIATCNSVCFEPVREIPS